MNANVPIIRPERRPTRFFDGSTQVEFDQAACAVCHETFGNSQGYLYGDSFYCDECIWVLADNGEFQ